MKDMFPRMEKKGINLNDLQYFKDVKRDEALRFFSDKWAMVHNCEKNLEDIAEEMVTLTKKQGLLIKQETYQMEEMNLLEREILFFLASMKKTMHPDYYATFQTNSKWDTNQEIQLVQEILLFVIINSIDIHIILQSLF